jgi:hypothetical protein
MDDAEHLWGIGRGIQVAFSPSTGADTIGIGAADKLACNDGTCKPVLRFNGDETSQGRVWRFPDDNIYIEQISLYRY